METLPKELGGSGAFTWAPPREQWRPLGERGRGSIAAAADRAITDRAIAGPTCEWPVRTTKTHQLRLKNWFGPGRDRVLADAHPHGSWIEWEPLID